jgi:membrane-associated phospholipid phosphatase
MISGAVVTTYWFVITRFGEVQNLLPAALWVCLALVRSEATRPLAYRWLFWLALVSLVDIASKIVFIGWGVGLASWNFTGFSGHAMYSAAIYPLLLVTLAARLGSGWRRLALAAGFLLAAVVGVSRVMVDAHSVSEVVLGLLLGAVVTLRVIAKPGLHRVTWRLHVPVLLAVWMVLAPLVAPPMPTHWMVTRLALQLSGRVHPYTRLDLRRVLHPLPPAHPAQATVPG